MTTTVVMSCANCDERMGIAESPLANDSHLQLVEFTCADCAEDEGE